MKVRVLIIDKNDEIRFELQSGLKKHVDSYDFLYTDKTDGVEESLNVNEIDIVLADISLEKKEDIQLLKSIKEDFPELFIVVFTGEESKLNVNDIYRFSHQILSKPINVDKVIESFERRKRMMKYLHDGKLMGVINNITDLPTLPETYLKIEEEMASKNVSVQRISSILSHDLSFTVKILHVVNSPFFGLKYKINNVMQAVSLLGVNIIKSLVLYHHTFSISPIGPKFKNYFEQLWIHSNKVGRYAEQILYDTNQAELEMIEEAYIAGLLHDIGKVVMLNIDGYPDKVFEYIKEHETRFSNAEYKIFGTSHSEIGAYFLSLWGLPERTAESVFTHNNPSLLDFSRFTVESAVFIANILANEDSIDLTTIQKLNLGVHPKTWVEYLEEHNLMKESPSH